MVQNVLVAVDGTKASKTALEVACGLADKYDAVLGLVTVVEPDRVGEDLIRAAQDEGMIAHGATYSNTVNAEYGTYTVATVQRDIDRTVNAARLATILANSTAETARAYSAGKPFKEIKTFVANGDPAKAIVKCAKENAADIIIMGHDEPKWYKAPFKKSVAKKVQRQAACPVLVYSSPANA